MEITSWTIYWITRLDIIQSTANVVAICSFILIFVVVISYPFIVDTCDIKDIEIKIRKARRTLYIVFVVFLLASMFIPTTKEIAAIIMLPSVSRNEDAKEIPSNISKLLNEKLKQWIDETENGEGNKK